MFKTVLGYTLVLSFIVGTSLFVVRNLAPEPVRYRWDSGTKCIVRVETSWHSCERYTKEQLNEFRLEWSKPKGYTAQ